MNWLLNRLYNLNEHPIPRFAFLGTTNWMRALSLLVCEGDFTNQALRNTYLTVQRRVPNQEADTLAFGYLLMALHNVASINKSKETNEPYALVRSVIVAWYYSIYYASKAMIAATSGSDPQTHSKTAKIWQSEIIQQNDVVVFPFNLNINDLTPNNVIQKIAALRENNSFDLNTVPTNHDQALGAAISYLKGTAEYQRESIENEVRTSRAFLDLGVDNFRSNNAKALRDDKLRLAHVNILVQAFRYRGKANYRDAIYLSYGPDYSETLHLFINDMAEVANAFTLMASHYISRRVTTENWQNFTEDLLENARFELPIDILEV